MSVYLLGLEHRLINTHMYKRISTMLNKFKKQTLPLNNTNKTNFLFENRIAYFCLSLYRNAFVSAYLLTCYAISACLLK